MKYLQSILETKTFKDYVKDYKDIEKFFDLSNWTPWMGRADTLKEKVDEFDSFWECGFIHENVKDYIDKESTYTCFIFDEENKIDNHCDFDINVYVCDDKIMYWEVHVD